MTRPSNKDSILAITLLLLILSIYFREQGLVYAAIIVIIISLLFKQVADKLDEGWQWIGRTLGLISSTIILSIVFFGIVFPIGLLLKAAGKHPLLLKQGSRATSFVTRHKTFTQADLQNPF